MWAKHNQQFELGVVTAICNGDEAAVHLDNKIRGSDVIIESIETYRFEPGRWFVRHFLKTPAASTVDQTQFRGFAT